MPKLHPVLWIIIALIVIGLLPGLYHVLLSALHSGVQTACPSCQIGHG